MACIRNEIPLSGAVHINDLSIEIYTGEDGTFNTLHERPSNDLGSHAHSSSFHSSQYLDFYRWFFDGNAPMTSSSTRLSVIQVTYLYANIVSLLASPMCVRRLKNVLSVHPVLLLGILRLYPQPNPRGCYIHPPLPHPTHGFLQT